MKLKTMRLEDREEIISTPVLGIGNLLNLMHLSSKLSDS